MALKTIFHGPAARHLNGLIFKAALNDWYPTCDESVIVAAEVIHGQGVRHRDLSVLLELQREGTQDRLEIPVTLNEDLEIFFLLHSPVTREEFWETYAETGMIISEEKVIDALADKPLTKRVVESINPREASVLMRGLRRNGTLDLDNPEAQKVDSYATYLASRSDMQERLDDPKGSLVEYVLSLVVTRHVLLECSLLS